MNVWTDNLGLELPPAFRYNLGLEEVKEANTGGSDTTRQVIAVTNTVAGLAALVLTLQAQGRAADAAAAQAKANALQAGQTPAQANATAGVSAGVTLTPTVLAVGGVVTLGVLGAVYYLARMG